LNKIVNIFNSPEELSAECAKEFAGMVKEAAGRNLTFTVALSGGSTPELLFSILAEKYSTDIPWDIVHFFWGDERCVPPDNSESNYGMTKKILLDKISIPSENIHRIRGEEDPDTEAARYAEEISGSTLKRDGLPCFNLILLGMGDDGHTASIFPGNLELLTSDRICAVAIHPVTSQKRITMTGKILNNADYVIFMVTGMKKQNVVNQILDNMPSASRYPASFITPIHGSLKWFLDSEAANLL
jgi:6-phosphogluconolactonase